MGYLKDGGGFGYLRGAGGGVIHRRRTPFLLHKYGLPFLPAARPLGHVSLRRLVSRCRFDQLPLLPVVISCGKNTARVGSDVPGCRGDGEAVRLTVFGFGLQRAVLGTLVRHQNLTEEVGTALQLPAHRPAEVGDLLRQPDDPEGGAVRLSFVSEEDVSRRRSDVKKCVLVLARGYVGLVVVVVDTEEQGRSLEGLCLLGFEGLLLTLPALLLQLLQLLQDSSRLVGGVDHHAQQLQAQAQHLIQQHSTALLMADLVKEPLRRRPGNEASTAHLFEDQRALPGPDGLRQLGDASLVEVRSREAAVVDEYPGAGVPAVSRT